MSEQEILDWYAARYGDEVLQEPPRRGVGLLVWVLPVLGIVAGTVWLVTLLRKWAAARPAPLPAADAPAPRPAEADEYLRRVEQELQNRDV